MNTKLLMTLSAATMGGAGLLLSFLPQEVMAHLDATASINTVHALVLHLTGALYFGFAMINWTAKANLIGGIYSRPVAIGNFTHWIIGALALLKGYLYSHEAMLLAPVLIYVSFAIAFGIVFFTHPVKEK